MKIIKSFLLVSFSLGVSVVLHAQQVQEEKNAKQLPAALTKSPSPDTRSSLPATVEIKADAVPSAPSPVTRENDNKLPGQQNFSINTVAADKVASTQLPVEPVKPLDNTRLLPEQSAVAAGTAVSKPQPSKKPVLAKEQ